MQHRKRQFLDWVIILLFSFQILSSQNGCLSNHFAIDMLQMINTVTVSCDRKTFEWIDGHSGTCKYKYDYSVSVSVKTWFQMPANTRVCGKASPFTAFLKLFISWCIKWRKNCSHCKRMRVGAGERKSLNDKTQLKKCQYKR